MGLASAIATTIFAITFTMTLVQLLASKRQES